MSKRQRDAFGAPNKKVAKNRFKKLVRSVILNMQWLNEAAEDTGISLNVKKNVAMSVRQKRKVGMMTMAEKSLLRTPHPARSVEDRKKLCNIVANLACFSKFPPKVRARLVPYVKFMAVTPGRIIMKEGDVPVTIYFLIAGEVEMSRNVFNKATKLYELHSEAIFGPGDCIGDIDVLENSPRTNTYVATTNCEFLAVFKQTYEQVLQPVMQKLWQEKKTALRALDYFDFLNDEQTVNACKYANIQQFDPLETIYTEDLGSMSSVYFVLSGECVILQCLHMKVNVVNREKVYQLAKVSKKLDVDDDSKAKNEPFFDVQEYVMSSSSEDEKSQSKTRGLRKMGLKEIQKACAEMKKPPPSRRSTKEVVRKMSRSQTGEHELERKTKLVKNRDQDPYELYLSGAPYGEGEEGYDLSEGVPSSSMTQSSAGVSESSAVDVEPETEGSEIFTASHASIHTEYTRTSGEETEGTDRYETHFIDVGSLTYGGIFGLGEKMAHRVIMARTTVQCILIPRFWLLEPAQNPGNVWQRKRFYIECNIPTREALYKNFLKTRKWEKFRHDYIQNILDPDTLVRFTKVEDIPIISRIVETRVEEPPA